MWKATTLYLSSTVALGCLALALSTINCGGSSAERPSGSGGAGTPSGGAGGSGGTGGAGGSSGSSGSSGTGGSSSAGGLNCAAAVTPANGLVTDFSESANTSNWGVTTGLYGSVYSYAGSSSKMDTAKIEGTPKGLHLTGGVAANDYGGGGLGFSVCATAASFTKIQFDVVGSSPGCDVELQIQTFEQRPKSQTPPGGCDSNCYNFPVYKKVVDLTTPITTAQTVTQALADFSGWTSTTAAEVVGMQWQFTGTNIASSDGGAATCPIDVTISNIKFVP
jgi:hypothetical protein